MYFPDIPKPSTLVLLLGPSGCVAWVCESFLGCIYLYLSISLYGQKPSPVFFFSNLFPPPAAVACRCPAPWQTSTAQLCRGLSCSQGVVLATLLQLQTFVATRPVTNPMFWACNYTCLFCTSAALDNPVKHSRPISIQESGSAGDSIAATSGLSNCSFRVCKWLQTWSPNRHTACRQAFQVSPRLPLLSGHCQNCFLLLHRKTSRCSLAAAWGTTNNTGFRLLPHGSFQRSGPWYTPPKC